jgi:hypothetical protein
MKTELQKKLFEKYSCFFQTNKKIFTGEKPLTEEIKELSQQKEIVEPMQFGIECNDGWYWIIDNLMECIYKYCKDNKIPFINIIQIKEKYGSLSFYYTNGDEMINGMVWLAEHMSYNTCEFCGSTENVGHTYGWVYTICEDCTNKNEKIQHLTWEKKQN